MDVSHLVREAQPIASAAGEVYLRHTQPWFVGLVAHGSALKGDFIANCSDIDLQLFLDPGAFTENDQLPLTLCISIQRDLARISPVPFRYIQCYAHSNALPAGLVGPIPGAYSVLAGRLPVPEASAEQLLSSASTALTALAPVDPTLPSALLDSGEGRLQRQTRYTCTKVWPVLYQLLTLQQQDPISVWNLPKSSAVSLLSEVTPPGKSIRAFDAAVRAYYPAEATADGALEVIRRGVNFLRAAKDLVTTKPAVAG
jgi:hypothetical protein